VKQHYFETAMNLLTGEFVKLDWYDDETNYYHVTDQKGIGSFVHESDLTNFCL